MEWIIIVTVLYYHDKVEKTYRTILPNPISTKVACEAQAVKTASGFRKGGINIGFGPVTGEAIRNVTAVCKSI